MPQATARNCSQAGCNRTAVENTGRCAAHPKKERPPFGERTKDTRPSAHRRGYGGYWKELRQAVLRRDPVCMACKVRPARHADHILPKRDGGRDEMRNLQGLCHSCHSRKTIRGH